MPKASHTKPQIISAIKATARRLRRTPTRSEFERLTGIHWTKVQRLFGGYRVAVREAGLEPDPGGIRIDTAAMLEDFGRLARKLKRHPTRDEYERLGRYASASLETRFHRWSAVRENFLEFVARDGLEREWGDVAERLRNGPLPRRGGGKNWLKPILPQICADERRSNRSLLPQMNADEHRSKAEPMRAEVLYPQLRGMRCVTRTVLWAMRAFGNPTLLKYGGMEEAEEEFKLDCAQRRPAVVGERGLGYSDVPEIIRTDKSVCATQLSSSETECTDRSVSTPADETQSLLGAPVSTPADQRRGLLGTPVSTPADQRRGLLGTPVCATRFWMNESNRIPGELNVPELYFPRRVIPGRPVMGPPLMLHGLACEPVNEAGVVFLFGMVAHRLGFWVESLQMAYPDCEAKLEVEPGRWQHVHIEFEFESRHFRAHRHDEKKCDILVCWRHNWKGCPKEMQVVELSKMLGR
jgi:hypothetical protein